MGTGTQHTQQTQPQDGGGEEPPGQVTSRSSSVKETVRSIHIHFWIVPGRYDKARRAQPKQLGLARLEATPCLCHGAATVRSAGLTADVGHESLVASLADQPPDDFDRSG